LTNSLIGLGPWSSKGSTFRLSKTKRIEVDTNNKRPLVGNDFHWPKRWNIY
jgi:hypothetical protein